ncbi:MAG: hypothetical protein ABJB66_05200 [Gemmatimonadaceae bacterium]
MGKALRRIAGKHRTRWRTTALILFAAVSVLAARIIPAQTQTGLWVKGGGVRLDSGRITIVADRRDERLARSLLSEAVTHDTFPGLPRPKDSVLIAIAPTAEMFRAWVGKSAPEWGAAIAIPDLNRIIMQGSFAGSDAGNPIAVLRHELAHLALHEFMGALPPRWFDEGYASVAAGEWTRSSALETSVSLAWRALPSTDNLDEGFAHGASQAEWSYALAQLVVQELRDIDQQNGLHNFFVDWKNTGSYEKAVRSAYGMTGAGFDDYWHKQVRRRYGALAFFANASLAFGFIGILMGPLFWARRRRDKRRLEAMRAADAVAEALERASALEALLNGSTDLTAETSDGEALQTQNPGGDSLDANRSQA